MDTLHFVSSATKYMENNSAYNFEFENNICFGKQRRVFARI